MGNLSIDDVKMYVENHIGIFHLWEFISGDEHLYLDIIEPLGFKAKEKSDEFMQSYTQMINKFTGEFIQTYCLSSGEIDWKKIVHYNSAKEA